MRKSGSTYLYQKGYYFPLVDRGASRGDSQDGETMSNNKYGGLGSTTRMTTRAQRFTHN